MITAKKKRKSADYLRLREERIGISAAMLCRPKHFVQVNECINKITAAMTITHWEYAVHQNANIKMIIAKMASHQLLHILCTSTL